MDSKEMISDWQALSSISPPLITMCYILITIAFAIISGVNSIYQHGPCPNLTAEDFSFSKMAGEWHEWRRSMSTADKTATCGKLHIYKPVGNKAVISFTATSSLINGNAVLPGVARIVRNKAYVDLHLPVLGIMKNMEFYILGTDYEHYYLIWSCENHGANHMEKLFVKIRHLEDSQNITAIVKNELKKRGLSYPPMTPDSSPDCF